jgi:hypothetical protein
MIKVGSMKQISCLLSDYLDNGWVGMAKATNRDTGQGVQILIASSIP